MEEEDLMSVSIILIDLLFLFLMTEIFIMELSLKF
jgi:hypothetical protein